MKLPDLLYGLNNWVKTAFYLNDKDLSVFRVLYSSLALLIIGIPNYSWLSKSPSILFNPPKYSVAALFNEFPSAVSFHILSIALIIGFIFLLFGFYTKVVSLLVTICMLLGQSFVFSFGKIDHNILFVLLPFFLAYSGWGNHYSIDKIRKKQISTKPWLVTILALTLGFAMFTAGVPKYLHGWLDVSTQATQGYFIKKYYTNVRPALIAPLLMKIKNATFWESLDYLAVIFELGFLFAILRTTIFRFFILLALWFHFANGLMLNVYFVSNFVVYLLFIPRSFYTTVQYYFDERWSKYITYTHLLIALLVGLLSYFYLSFHLPFSEISITPSLLKIILIHFTENSELLVALLIALTGVGLGSFYCINYIRKKILCY